MDLTEMTDINLDQYIRINKNSAFHEGYGLARQATFFQNYINGLKEKEHRRLMTTVQVVYKEQS